LDWYFWLPIVLGGVLGLVASVTANLVTPHVFGYLSHRKVARIENSKKRAAETYLQLLDLHSGRKDKYLYFISHAVYIVIALLGVVFSVMAAGIVIMVDSIHRDTWSTFNILNKGAEFIFGLFAGYFVYRTNLRTKHMIEWRWRLDNFRKYEADFKKQYGELPKSGDDDSQ
jgi:hypothetical protein